MSFFTYITGIALGNIAGDMVVHRDIKLIDGVTGLTLWTIFTIIVEVASLKSSRARILKLKGVNRTADVFYAELQSNGDIYIEKRAE